MKKEDMKKRIHEYMCMKKEFIEKSVNVSNDAFSKEPKKKKV